MIRIKSEFTVINGQPGHPADGGNGQGYGSENYIESWGWLEKGNGILYVPQGIAIDSQNGYIYIADTGNTLIQKFDTGGIFLKHWGYSGRVWTMYAKPHDEANFDFPINVATDTAGNIYHLRIGSDYGGDPRIERVQQFDQNGNLLMIWNDNWFTEGMSGIIYNPYNSRIYVSNTQRNRIQYFGVDGTDPTGNGTNYFNFNSPN